MQKKLIALAVAGLASTAAFAQTNVVVYGVADGTMDYVWTSGRDNRSAEPLADLFAPHDAWARSRPLLVQLRPRARSRKCANSAKPWPWEASVT